MNAKQQLRERVWSAVREAGAARFPGVEGRIPNFVGAERAARLLSRQEEWAAAHTVKANPDSPQWPVRTLALEEGKVVYMAVPRLAEPRPFWRLDPARLQVPPREASSIKGAVRHGEPVTLAEMEHIDLVVCGSVAVERGGARLGKGGGYSDLEFGLAVEAGLVDAATVVATTVHPSQLLDDGTVPLAEHDFPLDLIVTPEEVVRTNTTLSRPGGILWAHLAEEKAAAIPVLAALHPGRRRVEPAERG